MSVAVWASICALMPEKTLRCGGAERGKTEALRRKVLTVTGKLLLWIALSTKKMRHTFLTCDFGGASLPDHGAK